MADLTPLADQVTRIIGAKDSAVALIQGFAAYVEAHKTDPVALQNYVDSLNAAATELGDAVAANPLPGEG